MDRYLELWAQSLPSLLLATVQVTIPLTLISFVLALVPVSYTHLTLPTKLLV